MKLTTKLPIGLGIICMMLTSCSKEDVQTPAPRAESVNTSSNLKVDAAAVASISSTKGVTGINILPVNWTRNVTGYSNNQFAFPAGVSNIKNLWGDPSTPFVQSLSIIPWAPNINSFITVTTKGIANNSNKSSVKTKLQNLIIGKKYSLTVYVSSSLPKGVSGEANPTFAKTGLIRVSSPAAFHETAVDLTSYKNCWVQKIVTFTASSTQMDFAFSASPAMPGQYACAHLLVTDNAVKALN